MLCSNSSARAHGVYSANFFKHGMCAWHNRLILVVACAYWFLMLCRSVLLVKVAWIKGVQEENSSGYWRMVSQHFSGEVTRGSDEKKFFCQFIGKRLNGVTF